MEPAIVVIGRITEASRIGLVLIGMQNRTFDPYLAAKHRILVSVMMFLKDACSMSVQLVHGMPACQSFPPQSSTLH
jgi:hypothetical protein